MKIRIFNESGIERFREYIADIRDGSTDAVPGDLITSDEYSEEESGVEIEKIDFSDKSEIVKYLHDKISQLDGENRHYDVGLWSWLSAFYFDTVCRPPKKDGTRGPGEDSRHILNVQEWKRYYRHLLAAPVRLYSEMGDLSRIYLAGKPYVHGELLEQLGAYQEVATSKGIVEAATILYWDEDKNEIKRGARSKGSGSVRRLPAIISQFQVTYDLNTMTGNEIVELLPEEFDSWKP